MLQEESNKTKRRERREGRYRAVSSLWLLLCLLLLFYAEVRAEQSLLLSCLCRCAMIVRAFQWLCRGIALCCAYHTLVPVGRAAFLLVSHPEWNIKAQAGIVSHWGLVNVSNWHSCQVYITYWTYVFFENSSVVITSKNVNAESVNQFLRVSKIEGRLLDRYTEWLTMQRISNTESRPTCIPLHFERLMSIVDLVGLIQLTMVPVDPTGHIRMGNT